MANEPPKILNDPNSKPPVLILVPVGNSFYDCKISKNAEFLLNDKDITEEDVVQGARIMWKLPKDAIFQFLSGTELDNETDDEPSSAEDVTPTDLRLKRNSSPRILSLAKPLSYVHKFEPSLKDPAGIVPFTFPPGMFELQGSYETGMRDLKWTVKHSTLTYINSFHITCILEAYYIFLFPSSGAR